MKALYVHIPFCQHICSYCDFCKVYYKEDWASQYLDALSYEIKQKSLSHEFQTIYIGGGTPSALSYVQLEKLFQLLQPYQKKVREYSIEANPESLSKEKLELFIKNGINRLSIGVQTFQDHLLKHIERYHTSTQAIRMIHMAYDMGIQDINVDLIYGLPHQTFEDLKKDLDILMTLPISHVSIYSLILEDHTLLKNQNYQPLDEEQDALWYAYINQTLQDNHFIHYEVSNYYKTKPSLHNLTYWHYEDYEGIGLGAHSLKNHYYIENTKSFSQYINHQFIKTKQPLTSEDELFEKIMMGLRLTKGLNIEEINTLFHIDFYSQYETIIKKYQEKGMLVLKNDYLATTPLGMNYLNTILVDFLK